tara:strand:- start:127 stop:717 length:591 start_codon:yes stop_codon:yes gene_type:complete
MKETILIITFLSIVIIFIFIHVSEVSYHEAFTGDHYLVRNLDDKDKAADTLANMKTKLKTLVEHTLKKCEGNNNDRTTFIKPYINTINSKFNFIIFRESTDNSKFTSYSVNKGEEIVFCLRSKDDNSFHDINELMYVAIHEIAHVGCPEIGHTPLFKEINQELLRYAIECNVYSYKDYNSFPEDYCGIRLSNNILN